MFNCCSVEAVLRVVFTYQLEGDEDVAQIHSAMASAMCNSDADGIAFWRPMTGAVPMHLGQASFHRKVNPP